MQGDGVEPSVDQRLGVGCESETSVALREVDPRETHVELSAHELEPVTCRIVFADELIDEFADPCFLC